MVPYCTMIIYIFFQNLTTSSNRLFGSRRRLQSLLKKAKGRLRDMQPMGQHDGHGQDTQSTSLVSCGEGDRNHVNESADSQSDLERYHVEKTVDALLHVVGENILDTS